MAGKGKFHIPSVKDMDNTEDKPLQVKSLFSAHKSSKLTSKEPPLGSAVNNLKTSGSGTQGVISSVNRPSQLQKVVTDSERTLTASSTSSNTTPSAPSSSAQSTQPSSDNQSANNKETPLVGKPGKTNSLIVSTRQRGNPILKHVRNIPWEFGDIIPDYVMGQATCALFLSLRYHALNPNYIHERLKHLGHSFDLRVLLVQVDTKDPQYALKQLAKVCILADCTLILAWTPEEAGRYLETYKSFEVKPPDLIMEKTDSNYMSQLTDTLTTVKKVNKTDAMTLLTAFGSLEKIVLASEEDLSLCPGFGPQKAKRLHSVFHEPFIKSKKTKPQETSSPPKKPATPRKKKVDPS